MERFLLDVYKPQQLSTYALTLFRYPTKVENESIIVGKLLFCMLENLAVPQLDVQHFAKMECHIIMVRVVMPTVMGMRLFTWPSRSAYLTSYLFLWGYIKCYVWVNWAGRHLRWPHKCGSLHQFATVMVEMMKYVYMCVYAEMTYYLYMPCDEMSAHENLLNQIFIRCI
jgi:hypothetical protein